MPIIATPGDANANSYCTEAEADAYWADHLFASGWATASSALKQAALIQATRLLDGMPAAWTGGPASSDTQALAWPRKAMKNRNGFAIAINAVPNDLKNAEAELAGYLMRNDPSGSGFAASMGITSVKIEGLQLQFHDEDITAGETPAHLQDPARTNAQEALVPASVLNLLVPSWLIDKRNKDAPFSGLFVETL